ncbi:EF-hand domain-containing protein [Dyella sp. KRB-257]|uniref:EF-hand domain-containing protein n=1 Tax=Dyella sp. KRB-257 TaxID=3400915 RepID=UPI003C0DCC14
MRPMLALGLFVALGVIATAAQAQMMRRSDPAERFAQADTNHDGRITHDEFVAGRAARFAKVDRNGDGYISDDDLPAFARSHAGMVQKVHALQQATDLDGDGRISRAEFEQAGEKLFALVDANGDGAVDQAEMRQMAEHARALAGK